VLYFCKWLPVLLKLWNSETPLTVHYIGVPLFIQTQYTIAEVSFIITHNYTATQTLHTTACTKTYRDNLDLIGGLRWAEMSAIMFNGFITSVKAIATSVAVPVSSTYLFCTFYWTDNIASITAPHYTQAFTTATHHSTHTVTAFSKTWAVCQSDATLYLATT